MISPRPLARGDLVLITFPFSDLSGQKLRPALIIGRVDGPDLTVAFITSRSGGASSRAELALDPADPEFSSTGLKVASLIRLDKIATLHRDLIRRRIGRIGPRTGRAVTECLQYAFDL